MRQWVYQDSKGLLRISAITYNDYSGFISKTKKQIIKTQVAEKLEKRISRYPENLVSKLWGRREKLSY